MEIFQQLINNGDYSWNNYNCVLQSRYQMIHADV